MPQPSYTYASARLSALSKRLVEPQTVKRMADGTLEDALRTLQDIRYGGSSEINETNIEQVIASELKETMEEIRALSPDPSKTDLFLMKADVQNLKAMLKARLLGDSEYPFTEGGLYSKEVLASAVKDHHYEMLPKPLTDAMTALEKQVQIFVDPQQLSVELDRAYLKHAMRTAEKDPVLNSYFKATADFNNILTFLRVRAMGGYKEMLDDLLLPEGGIPQAKLKETFDLSYESLNKILDLSVCKSALLAGLNAMQRTGNIGEVEKARDNYLISLFTPHKYETDSIYPIIGYYLAKERESRAIRLIVTAKRNRLPDSVISERLVTLYGER